jgi:hypothetical protein
MRISNNAKVGHRSRNVGSSAAAVQALRRAVWSGSLRTCLLPGVNIDQPSTTGVDTTHTFGGYFARRVRGSLSGDLSPGISLRGPLSGDLSPGTSRNSKNCNRRKQIWTFAHGVSGVLLTASGGCNAKEGEAEKVK